MIRYFCDKCGKELDKLNNEFTSDIFKVVVEPPDIRRWTDDAETDTYILCYDCVRKFNKWINGERASNDSRRTDKETEQAR